MRYLRPAMNSEMIYLMQCKRKILPGIIPGPKLETVCGKRGNNVAQRLGYLGSYTTLTTPYSSFKSYIVGTRMDGSPVVVQQSGLAFWKKPYIQ